ncbi:MAG TPA: hypothetical protein VLB27_02695, partial [candidate division Zixibacteria bacterium]|nr:hypothetical protein [candidate division Zixibacteria bacterium]
MKRSAISLALALGVAGSVAAQAAIDTSIIRVVYPKYRQSIAAVDSTFIIGSVPPGWTLTANGHPVEVHAGGGWLAYLPLTPGAFTFALRAARGAETVALDWPALVPELPLPDSFTAPLVYSNNRIPSTPRSFHLGDVVDLQMRGTPGCRAWAEIPGFADSIPMSESQGVAAPFYGASVWEDSDNHTPRILGVYQGIYQLDSDSAADSLAVIYHIARPSFADALRYLRERAPAEIQFEALRALKWGDGLAHASDTAEPLLSFNPVEFPRTVEFTDTVQIVRVGPRRGYLGLFQPAGVRALADGFDGEWYTIRLTDT